jgi:hypothetical protein
MADTNPLADVLQWRRPDFGGSADEAMARIAATGVPLANDLATLRWNSDKSYLRDLARRGVTIVPTRWGEGTSRAELRARRAARQREQRAAAQREHGCVRAGEDAPYRERRRGSGPGRGRRAGPAPVAGS